MQCRRNFANEKCLIIGRNEVHDDGRPVLCAMAFDLRKACLLERPARTRILDVGVNHDTGGAVFEQAGGERAQIGRAVASPEHAGNAHKCVDCARAGCQVKHMRLRPVMHVVMLGVGEGCIVERNDKTDHAPVFEILPDQAEFMVRIAPPL